MGHKFAEIMFSDEAKQIQQENGSRQRYENFTQGEDSNFLLSEREAEFIQARDSFYMASVSETLWPYVQHRGGPQGFLKVIDAQTLAFADFRGNRQYISTGNFRTNNRVSLFFMDYPNRTRLKMIGRISEIPSSEIETLAALEDENYRARVERGFFIKIEAFDWNCPQHITPRFTEKEIENLMQASSQELQLLREENRQLKEQIRFLQS